MAILANINYSRPRLSCSEPAELTEQLSIADTSGARSIGTRPAGTDIFPEQLTTDIIVEQ